jgi:hypothetical protein
MLRIENHVRLRRFTSEVVRVMLTRIDEIRDLVAASRGVLEPRQRATLDIGCWVVLSTLAIGLQLGGWSAWTVLVAAGGYLVWVLAYSEASVHATRRQRAPRLAASD